MEMNCMLIRQTVWFGFQIIKIPKDLNLKVCDDVKTECRVTLNEMMEWQIISMYKIVDVRP